MDKQILNVIKNLEQKVVDLYYKVKTGVGATGPQGPTGPQGIQGSTGEVGPAGVTGLTWRGTWSAGTAYLANDAVGYNGASYFRLISGTTAGLPNVDTTNWALLASQGAVGPQGAQGPTGAQGPIGPIGPAGTSATDTFRGQWDFSGGTTYAVGDIVTSFTYSNDFQYQMWGTYRCIQVPTSNFNPGVDGLSWVQLGLTQIAKGTKLKGTGQATDPITLKGYKRSGYIFAIGTNNPQRSVNFFTGMELPPGVTESFVRVSTGSYELRYTALVGNTFVTNLGLSNYFEYSFSMNDNIVYGGSFTTTSGGNQTLVIGFQNKPGGVLTDGFSTVNYRMEWFE